MAPEPKPPRASSRRSAGATVPPRPAPESAGSPGRGPARKSGSDSMTTEPASSLVARMGPNGRSRSSAEPGGSSPGDESKDALLSSAFFSASISRFMAPLRAAGAPRDDRKTGAASVRQISGSRRVGPVASRPRPPGCLRSTGRSGNRGGRGSSRARVSRRVGSIASRRHPPGCLGTGAAVRRCGIVALKAPGEIGPAAPHRGSRGDSVERSADPRRCSESG